MNVILAGWTAAGKTTHARLLAREFDLTIMWAAGSLLERLGFEDIQQNESRYWFERNDEVEQRRHSSDADTRLDADLIAMASSRTDVVFDARFLAWLSDAPALRIWLGSDLESRARKCAFSLGLTDTAGIAEHIIGKDERDSAHLSRLRGVPYHADSDVFPVVLDSTILSRTDSAVSVRETTDAMARYLTAVVTAYRGDREPLDRLRSERPAEYSSVVQRAEIAQRSP